MRNFFLFLIIITAAACNKKEFCIVPGTITMGMNFKTYDSSNNLVDTFLVKPSVYNTDTTFDFIDSKVGLNKVSVALNRKRSQQTYIVSQSITSDTIVISYSSEENFISNGCGYQTYFQLGSVTYSRNSIDSVKITNSAVNPNSLNDHLEVIYK